MHAGQNARLPRVKSERGKEKLHDTYVTADGGRKGSKREAGRSTECFAINE